MKIDQAGPLDVSQQDQMVDFTWKVAESRTAALSERARQLCPRKHTERERMAV